jgi:hypothetical protein
MIEFMRDTRMPVVTTSMPSASKTASNAGVNSLPRSLSGTGRIAFQNCFTAADLGVVPAVGHDRSSCSYG